MSRLSIELTPEQHNAVKALALHKGIPMKELVWAPIAKMIEKHQAKAAKTKGYGAGHPDCPLCQQFENARNGRYNKKTERGLRESMKEIKSGKLKAYKNADEMFRDLGLR